MVLLQHEDGRRDGVVRGYVDEDERGDDEDENDAETSLTHPFSHTKQSSSPPDSQIPPSPPRAAAAALSPRHDRGSSGIVWRLVQAQR